MYDSITKLRRAHLVHTERISVLPSYSSAVPQNKVIRSLLLARLRCSVVCYFKVKAVSLGVIGVDKPSGRCATLSTVSRIQHTGTVEHITDAQ